MSSSIITSQPSSITHSSQTDAESTAAGNHQADGGGERSASYRKADPFPFCVYFLVSKATTGPLADTFKLGFSGKFPGRHRQHTSNWDEFDLERSALVRVNNPRDMKEIERSLKQTFGDPAAEAAAEARGKTYTSEEFIVQGSYRRNPGRSVDGRTEFYTIQCLEEMLVITSQMLAPRNQRGVGATLHRGITPADCLTAAQLDAAPTALAKQERRARKNEYYARREREEQERWAQTEARIGQVLDLALDYESHVVWVDLQCWRRLRCQRGISFFGREALVDIFFDDFEASPTTASAGSHPQPSTRVDFDSRVASLEETTRSEDPRGWQFEEGDSVCYLDRSPGFQGFPPVQPFCAGKLRLRLTPWRFDVHLSLFTRYEALAWRVESRYPLEQQNFW